MLKINTLYSAYFMRSMWIEKAGENEFKLHTGVFIGHKESPTIVSYNSLEEASKALIEKSEGKQLYVDGVKLCL